MLLRRQFNFLHDIPHPSTLPTPLLTMDIHTIIATSIASQMSTVNNVWRLRRQPPTVARLVFFMVFCIVRSLFCSVPGTCLG